MGGQGQRGAAMRSVLVAIVVVTIVVLTLALVAWLVAGTRREANVHVQDGMLVITGQYGQTYPLADIEDVRLVQAAPAVGRKISGAGLGAVRKGDYEVAGLGATRLFLHSDGGPYLHILVSGKWTILNFGDPEKTVGIHDCRRSSWPER